MPLASTLDATDDLTLDDFITGLIAGFADQNVSSVSIRSPEFYTATERAFELLAARATQEHLDLRFIVAVDPIYGDSPSVRDAISGAVQRDLVSLDNPEYQDMRLKIGKREAGDFFERLPGRNRELFKDLAREFLATYPWHVRH